jgi:hypothetical protein
MLSISTYDHRSVKTGHPVRSAIHKHCGRLVLEWVTIWESRLLYVFVVANRGVVPIILINPNKSLP